MVMPAGACDCHVHIIGPAQHYPMLPDRAYTPGQADVPALRAHLERLAFGRAVIVQPSVYGSDNRCLLDALAQMQGRARGVAVLDDDVADAQLDELAAVGVAGIRLNLESTGQRDPGALRARLSQWSARLERLGWHMQVFASFGTILSALDCLEALRVPLVLDHFAMTPADLAPDDAGVQQLLQGLRSGRLYVKLSGAYRLPVKDAAAVCELAHRLAQANPDRILWASDWPHTNREPGKEPTQVSAYRQVPAAGLLSELHAWAPDGALLHKLLVDNPARLYGF